MFFNFNLWQKVSADLLSHKSRTVLAISSIAIGLFMIGTLLGMMDLQMGGMDSAHRQSQPSHINLIIKQDADIAVAERIKNIGGVADIDTMTQLTVQFKTPQSAQWQTGTVVFRADYRHQQYDRMTLLSGNFPSAKTVAVERLSARFAGLNTGDMVEFSTANGSEKLAIGGIIRHPFVKPPAFGGQLLFFIAPELAPAFSIPMHTFRQLLVQIKPPYSEDKARSIAGEIRAELAASGIAVNATLLQDPDRHWGRPIFSGINLVLTVMAWASLALSSVLILNTVAALITQQTDQIGIMKSLGARRRTIAGIYLSEVFILSLIALIIAVPLSWAGAFYSSRWILDVFNIELNSFTYSSRALYFTMAGGVLAPLLAALWPIWQGAAMSVRQAIASYGLGADFVSHGVDRWLERAAAALLPTLYAVALGNLLRRKARLLWTQSVLIIAGVLFIVIMSLIASVNQTLNNELARSRYAVRIGFAQDQPADIINGIVRNIPSTTAVEFWNRLPAELFLHDALIRQSGSLGLQMIALPADTAMYRPLIVEGRWFDRTDDRQNRLVINAVTAELNGIQVGDTLTVKLLQQPAQEWQVIGLYRWFAGSGYAVESVYAPLSTIQLSSRNAHKHSFTLLSADIDSLAEEKTYVDELKTAFEQQHINLDFYTTQAKLEQRRFAENQFRPITSMLLGLAAMIAAVGAIGLSGTLAIGVLQRTREIAVLRAIGASSSAVFKLFMLEGLFHGLLAWLIGVPLAFLVAEPLAKQLGTTMLNIELDFVFSLSSVGFWLGFVLVLAILAAYLPARNASKIVVRAGLSY
jgi:putative ABC transport system permease protein